MIDHVNFSERCCDGLDGAVVSKGAFSPGPASWVGRREVAYFDGDDTLDVRLTKRLISERRAELQSDVRVALRPGSSDRIDIIRSDSDLSFASRVTPHASSDMRSKRIDRPQPQAHHRRVLNSIGGAGSTERRGAGRQRRAIDES